MPSADELRAALVVAELEDELAAAKDDGNADRDLKDRLRAARQEYREKYRTASDAVEDGIAEPDAIQTTATVEEA